MRLAIGRKITGELRPGPRARHLPLCAVLQGNWIITHFLSSFLPGPIVSLKTHLHSCFLPCFRFLQKDALFPCRTISFFLPCNMEKYHLWLALILRMQKVGSDTSPQRCWHFNHLVLHPKCLRNNFLFFLLL